MYGSTASTSNRRSCSRPPFPLPQLVVPLAPPFFVFSFILLFVSPLASASVTMQRASLGKLLFARQPHSFTACLSTVFFFSVLAVFAYVTYLSLKLFSHKVILLVGSCLLNFFHLPPARYTPGNAKCQAPSPSLSRAAWNLPLLQLVSLASVSIETVQAPTFQSGPWLRFGATPLRCLVPFAFQPNHISPLIT